MFEQDPNAGNSRVAVLILESVGNQSKGNFINHRDAAGSCVRPWKGMTSCFCSDLSSTCNRLNSADPRFPKHTDSRDCFPILLSISVFYIHILASEMAIPENQHCANCIDTLSFPVVVGFPGACFIGITVARGRGVTIGAA